MRPWRSSAASIVAAVVQVGCGGLGSDPPQVAPAVKGPTGERQHLVARGPYKAFYDKTGRLERIEYDTNGDGRPDRITHHHGSKSPQRLDVDVDFDGSIDRWEDFGEDGTLHRYAVAGADGRPHMWTVLDAKGAPLRYEYDHDVDGRFERAEIVENGRIARVELDTDGDGKVDRWQEWKGGRLESEALDIDGDGKPDRRLRYGPKGAFVGIEPIAAQGSR
jgi:hypothetical protein